MTIQKEKYEIFHKLFETQFESASDLWNDCALIAAFLDDCDLFDSVFKTHGEEKFAKAYTKITKNQTEDFKEQNRISKSFVELMKDHGFSEQFHNVTFTGNDSKFFIPTLQAGILFKDMVGSVHGRYAHTVQWYGICLLHESKQELGSYKFKYKPGKLYREIALHSSKDTFPGEVSKSTPKDVKIKTMWDFCVDCFLAGDGAQRGLESLAENLYSSTYRSPAVMTKSLTSGSLSNTFLGQSMKAGIAKYSKENSTKRYQAAAKKAAKEPDKQKMMFCIDTKKWVVAGDKVRGDGTWVGGDTAQTIQELNEYRSLPQKL